jgi:hypothetical protein
MLYTKSITHYYCSIKNSTNTNAKHPQRTFNFLGRTGLQERKRKKEEQRDLVETAAAGPTIQDLGVNQSW